MAPQWHDLARCEVAERRRKIEAELLQSELHDAERVAQAFSSLLDHVEFVMAADRVVAHLHGVASPGRAALAMEDWVATMHAERGHSAPLFVEPALSIMLTLAGASTRAARHLATFPWIAIELANGPIDESRDFSAALAPAIGQPQFDARLRRFRTRQLLRIALRELRGDDLRETAEEIADVAQVCMNAATEHHLRGLVEEHGPLSPPNAYAVIGMGKLGGRELNFSSDIDVIYFYEHDEGGAGDLTAHGFFVKLFERAQRSLSEVTEHGFVFRVDADLRPEGKKGALANSLASAERYYQAWGRTWERAAWIRARPVAGDPEFGAQVMEMMRPFVYRRAFDLEAIESIVSMKRRVDAERGRRGRSKIKQGRDLKLGLGGIREIEFFVQAHQLLHGGRNERLREVNTLVALQQLEAAGLVSAKVRAELGDAYLLLRRVEHRVQFVEEQQTHRLPTSAEALDPIARSLGYETGVALDAALRDRMAAVHEIFASLQPAAREEEPIPTAIIVAADPETDEDDRGSALRELGAAAPFAAAANIEAAARHPRSPFHPRAPHEGTQLARALLFECWRSPDFDRALRHLPDLVRGAIVHRGLFEQLRRPSLRRGVARVLGASDLLARILTSSPSLLPHVLIGEGLPTATALRAELDERLGAIGDDIESALSVLRSVKQESTLRTAMADMADLIDTEEVGHRLGDVAEALIHAALGLARRSMVERFGMPLGADLVVVAGGTLGAFEMGYRTDLDLSFVYTGSGETTGGKRGKIRCAEYFTRLVQRFLQFLTLRTAQGDLYPVDMRLRPSGSQGPLVTSLERFEAYHQQAAQLWERQALVRCRTVAGPAPMRARVDDAIANAVYGLGPVADGRAQIARMRDRMLHERTKRRRGNGRDIKLGPGGLVEVEFLVQHLLIEHGRAVPSIRATSTRQALRKLQDAGLLAPDVAAVLLTGYDTLRKTQNWLRIAYDEMLDWVSFDAETLRSLALAVGWQGDEAGQHLARALEEQTAQIHAIYERLVGTSTSSNGR